ncbi:MAG: hypothetical protein ACLUML_08630 [Acutalibacteraceae bacterium]
MARRKSWTCGHKRKGIDGIATKLNSPQPPEKKISQHRLYKCDWKIGDVFAYQFNSEYAKENDFYRSMFIL